MCWVMSPWETLVSCPPFLLSLLVSDTPVFFVSQRPHASSQLTLPTSTQPCPDLFLLPILDLDSRRKYMSLAYICCLPFLQIACPQTLCSRCMEHG